jgi:hypothetical protein
VRPDGYLLPRRATLIAMSGVLLGMLLAALNQTIVPIELFAQRVFTVANLAGFAVGVVLMAVTLVLVLLIPELPLRRTVREATA